VPSAYIISLFKEQINTTTSERKSASRRFSYNLTQYQPHNILWHFDIPKEHLFIVIKLLVLVLLEQKLWSLV
jgi:hypothetical protein